MRFEHCAARNASHSLGVMVAPLPAHFAAARDRAADTAAITRPELEALARRYLDPERGFLFVAEPGSDHFWGRK